MAGAGLSHVTDIKKKNDLPQKRKEKILLNSILTCDV